MFIFVAFLIFSGFLFGAAWYVWVVPRQQTQDVLTTRLRELRAKTTTRTRSTTDLIKREKRGPLASLGDFVSWVGVLRRLQDSIDQANLKYRAAEVFSLCLIVFTGLYLTLGLFISMLALRVIIAGGIGSLPVVYIMWQRGKRFKKMEQQLPEAIDLFNRSMKAGHNIHSGLETIASETTDPVRMEFKKVMEELALGSQLEAALHNLGKRAPLVDLKFFIIGLILQRQTGANMVEVLDNLSALVRERLNLVEKMKAATAQQRFSAGLLCVMPIVVGFGFWILKPEYITLLYTDETGSKFLTYAIVSEIIGILVIRKIASPKF
jgi:tight adherence protein B